MSREEEYKGKKIFLGLNSRIDICPTEKKSSNWSYWNLTSSIYLHSENHKWSKISDISI